MRAEPVRLVGTPLREFWGEGGAVLFVGPWCASYGLRGEWKDIEHRILPDPWPELAKFQKAQRDCREFSDRVRGEIARRLNAALGADHGERYWRLILDPWITQHAEQMYDHYIHVEEAFRLEPNLRAILLDPASYETPRDTEDFVRMKTGPDFHNQMFSYFVAARLPDSPVRRALRPESREPLRVGPKDAAKSALARVVSRSGPLGFGQLLASELHLHRDELNALVKKSGFKLLPYYGSLGADARPAPDIAARRRVLAGIPFRSEFERLFVEALPTHLPTIYFEGHLAAARRTRAQLPRAPKVFFSSTGWHYTDAIKFAAADCAERGSRLWAFQHGGAYGTIDYSYAEVFERAIADRFYAWGWSKLSGDPKVRDLPAPMLSRSAAPAPGDEILFVCNAMDVYNIRLVRRSATASPADYIEREARLVNALPPSLRRRTTTRLPRRDWGWQQAERLRERSPDMRLDDHSETLATKLRRARIAVFDCPETTFLEAFAAGIPTVLTWDPRVWPFRPEAEPFFDSLKKNGILFDEPEEAAAQIARVDSDPLSWWNAPERRAATREFARTFALSSPDWMDAWLKEIREGLAEA